MLELNKFYTVEEIAKMTSLTTRTIRNYLKDGILKGRKIGGQWRFTTADIERFMYRGEVTSDLAEKQKNEVMDFMDGRNRKSTEKVQICTIVDLYIPEEQAKEISGKLCILANGFDGKSHLKYNYVYDQAEDKARYTIYAPPEFVADAMDIAK